MLKFLLYKRLGVDAYLFEHRVSQQIQGLPTRKTFVRLLCDL
jgi:hypothetical protein